MKILKTLVLLVICFSFASCHFVKTPRPFGLKPIDLDPEIYKGTWVGEDGDTCELTMLDAGKGVLELSYKEDGDKIKKLKVHLLEGKKWQYASVPVDEDGSDEGGFMFACIEATQKRIIIWGPRVEKFIKLIETGEIEGKVVKGDVVLDKITPELIDIIESEENGFVFEWREPMILTRQKSGP